MFKNINPLLRGMLPYIESAEHWVYFATVINHDHFCLYKNMYLVFSRVIRGYFGCPPLLTQLVLIRGISEKYLVQTVTV